MVTSTEAKGPVWPLPIKPILPTDIKKYSYVYIVMLALQDLGLGPCGDILKALAKDLQDGSNLIDDLNQLKHLLGDLLDSIDIDKPADMTWAVFLRGADGKGTASNCVMAQVKTWLDKTPAGETQTNGAALKAIFQKIFVTPTKGGQNGDLGQLEWDMQNPAYKQKAGLPINTVKDLWDSVGSENDWKKGDNSFNQYLQGGWSPSMIDLADALTTAYGNSWAKDAGTQFKDSTQPTLHDDVGKTTDKIESAKQNVNSFGTTESTDEQMFSQNETSFIQIGQQMIQYGGNETKQYVSNQAGRG